jgi:hypothetical protein
MRRPIRIVSPEEEDPADSHAGGEGPRSRSIRHRLGRKEYLFSQFLSLAACRWGDGECRAGLQRRTLQPMTSWHGCVDPRRQVLVRGLGPLPRPRNEPPLFWPVVFLRFFLPARSAAMQTLEGFHLLVASRPAPTRASTIVKLCPPLLW